MAWLKGVRGAGGIEVLDNVDFRGNVIGRSGANFAPTRSKFYYVDGTDGNDDRSGNSPGDALKTLTEAVSKAGNDDRIFIAGQGDWMRETAAIDWSYNDGQIIGNAMTPMQPRLDIAMAYTSTFNPQFTVSGRGNIIANITFRHGSETAADSNTGYATDLTCMLVSGRYNYFDNVYFYTPLYAEQDVAATYKGVQVTGHNNYFRGCRFGNDGLARDAANYNLVVSGIGNVFEDCIFNIMCDGNGVFFVYLNNTVRDMRHTLFKNCTFYAHSINYGNTPTYAFKTDSAMNTCGAILQDCNFVNVGQIASSADSAWIWKAMPEGENGADTTIISQIALRSQGA